MNTDPIRVEELVTVPDDARRLAVGAIVERDETVVGLWAVVVVFGVFAVMDQCAGDWLMSDVRRAE
jgi:hypothetical protein